MRRCLLLKKQVRLYAHTNKTAFALTTRIIRAARRAGVLSGPPGERREARRGPESARRDPEGARREIRALSGQQGPERPGETRRDPERPGERPERPGKTPRETRKNAQRGAEYAECTRNARNGDSACALTWQPLRATRVVLL